MITNTNASNYTINKFLNQVLKNITYTRPTNLYLALFTNNPDVVSKLESNTGWGAYEISSSTYNRKLFQTTSSIIHSVSPLYEAIFNSNNIEFDYPINADWNVGYIAVMDAETGGNVLFYKDFELLINRGDILIIPPDDFKITTSGTFSDITYETITYTNVRVEGMSKYLAESYLRLMAYTGAYGSFPQPSNVYIALFFGNPDTVCNNLYNNIMTDELSGNNYARVPISFVIDEDGIATSNIDVIMPLTDRTPNFKVTHFAITDSLTGGNVLHYGTFRNGSILNAFEIPDGTGVGLVFSRVRINIE